MNQRQFLIPTPLYNQYFIALHIMLNAYIAGSDHDEAHILLTAEHQEDDLTLLTLQSTNPQNIQFWGDWISERLATAHKIMLEHNAV